MYKKRILFFIILLIGSNAYGDPPDLTEYAEMYSAEAQIKRLTNSIAQDKKDSHSYFLRSTFYYKLKKYNLALDDINQAIRLNHKYYYLKSSIHEELNEITDALNSIEKAIKLAPSNGLFYEKRADIKYIGDDIEGAIKDVTVSFDLSFSFINSSGKDGSVFSNEVKESKEKILNEISAGRMTHINNLEKLDRKKAVFELYKLGVLYRYAGKKKKLKECIDKIRFLKGNSKFIISLEENILD